MMKLVACSVNEGRTNRKEGTLVQTQIIDIDPNYPLPQNLHTD